MKEHVLDQILDLGPRQACQQNRVNRASETRIQLAERIAVPRLGSEHERDVIACRRRCIHLWE
jgi:hypothetical protein